MALRRESINTNSSANERYRGLSRIIGNVLNTLDPGSDKADRRRWIRWHFLYIIWWEGARATARRQFSGGPARGLMQMEPATFWDITQNFTLLSNHRIQWLAEAAGVSSNEMDQALRAFIEKNKVWDDRLQWWKGRNSWPTSGGPERKIEDWQSNVDSFAVVMMRFHFNRLGNAHSFPPQNANNLSDNPQNDIYKAEHSLGWARWWKRWFSNPDEEARQRRMFEDRARELDDVAAGADGGGGNGGGPIDDNPDDRGGGCFIATAVYGVDSRQVRMLRIFRDQQLLPYWLGRKFVSAYYYLSPPIARIIGKSTKLKLFTRRMLNWLIQMVNK